MKGIEKILENIITPRFLKNVEKWARYDGENLSIGDSDLHVENKGVFTIKTTSPKLIFDHTPQPDGRNFSFKVSETETEDHYDYYDVTIIRNSCVCSEHDTRVLIAEIPNEYNHKLPKLFIYSIKGYGKGSKSQPSFNQLKEKFEGNKWCGDYQSLLRNFCDIYSLVPFNDKTDRIFNFTGVDNDLNWLESDSVSINASKHIETADWGVKYPEWIETLSPKKKDQ